MVQGTTNLPAPPSGNTIEGRGYRLIATAQVSSLLGASVSFNYLERDVPPGLEPYLRVFFWDGRQWRKLPTVLSTRHNFASARPQGPRLHVLMADIEVYLPLARR